MDTKQKEWDESDAALEVDLSQVGPHGVTTPEGWPEHVSHNALHRALVAYDDAHPVQSDSEKAAVLELRGYLAKLVAPESKLVDVLMGLVHEVHSSFQDEADKGMPGLLAALVPLLREPAARPTLPQSDLDWIADAPDESTLDFGDECADAAFKDMLQAYSNERDAQGLPAGSLENVTICACMSALMKGQPWHERTEAAARAMLQELQDRGLTQAQWTASNAKLFSILRARTAQAKGA